MRLPIRKGGQYTNIKSDPYMTEVKFEELKKNLARLKKDVHPELAQEVKRLALMGDFSENTAYQIAKGRLRSTNRRMEELTKQIANANIIEPNKHTQTVEIGHKVTIKSNNQTKEYLILGSSESDPSTGTISYKSPLGKTLLHTQVGDIAKLQLDDKTLEYEIIEIK